MISKLLHRNEFGYRIYHIGGIYAFARILDNKKPKKKNLNNKAHKMELYIGVMRKF